MLNAPQKKIKSLFDTIGDTISGLPKILLNERKIKMNLSECYINN